MAIHTETGKDAEMLDKEINNIFPGSSCAKLLTQTNFTKVVIKNINPFISTEDIKQFVDRKFNKFKDYKISFILSYLVILKLAQIC